MTLTFPAPNSTSVVVGSSPQPFMLFARMHLHFVDPHHELQQRLERVLQRLCPRWLRDDLDDLVQASMLKIHRRGDDINTIETGFLFRVGHSVMVDEIRRRKRRHEVSFEDTTAQNRPNTSEISPESAAAGTELGKAIHACLQTLKPDYRRAVSLRLHGHTVPEIAELLAVSPKKADNLVYRGMADLRDQLRKRGLTP